MKSCRACLPEALMPAYELSDEADADIGAITEYTVTTFGAQQAIKYISGLENTLDLLSRFSRIGLPSYDLSEGLYRFP
jgi:plasmid stabilization system protein ParE